MARRHHYENPLKSTGGIHVDCNTIAKKYLPEDKYKIKRVLDTDDKCYIDFIRKDYEPYVDCDEYCDMIVTMEEGFEEDYEKCVEECKENINVAKVGSLVIDKPTLSVEEATIPGMCIGISEDEDYIEEFNKLADKFNKIGCELKDSWIHPHELVPTYGREWEEEPAICYYHPKTKEKGKCKLLNVLKVVEENV